MSKDKPFEAVFTDKDKAPKAKEAAGTTKARWELSLTMKSTALELVCPVVNARLKFKQELAEACEMLGGDLDPEYYYKWAIEQATEEEVLDAVGSSEEEEEDEEEEEEEDDEE